MAKREAAENAARVVRDPNATDRERDDAARDATRSGASLADVRDEAERQDRR